MAKLEKKHETLTQVLRTLEQVIELINEVEHGSIEYILRRDAQTKRFEFCSELL